MNIRDIWHRKGKNREFDIRDVVKLDGAILPESVVRDKDFVAELEQRGFAVRTSQTPEIISAFKEWFAENQLSFRNFSSSEKRVCLVIKKSILEHA